METRIDRDRLGELHAALLARERERKVEAELAEAWAASERRDLEKRRRENAAAWYEHHMILCEAHSRLALEHQQAARSLREAARE